MGIQGLLPLLKDIHVTTSISSYTGLTVGIDAYCWLHKGAYGCATDLVLDKPTKVYVNYIMRRIDMLVSHNITPILVFDGGHLPAKADTAKARRSRRKEHRALGMAALKEGNTKVAYENFQKSIDITPEMASQVIQECFAMNVQCIVAPYEADAQLAYLMKEGITQLTISEDSDLLLYGCNKVMYKMSIDGDGIVIDLDNLSKVQTIQLASFTQEKFRHMCMLSGCDYLPSIKGMGLMKAFKALRRFSNVFQCIKSLKCNRSYSVPKEYEENFRKADLVFKYQLVFDIRTKRLVRLNNIDDLDKFEDAEKDFAGPKIDDAMGIQIALGNIDPVSGKKLAYLENFASGDITHKAQKASGWDSPYTATAFVFHDKSHKSDVNDIIPTNSQTSNKKDETIAVVNNVAISSPRLDASKSLKRLLDEDISVPTREEKIRKLYKEEVSQVTNDPEIAEETGELKETEETEALNDDQLFSPTVHKKHYNVFAKKTCTFKNTFKQMNNEHSQKTITSKFFTNTNKIADEKENYVLQVDTPSPEKDLTNESTKTIQGSFLDYLDKTNVRGYEVSRPILLSQISPKRTGKQIKINKTCSPKKSRRRNIFSVKSENIDKSLVPLSPKKHLNDSNIDFNVTISLDECIDKNVKKPCVPKYNIKKTNNIFKHFEHKPKVSIYHELSKKEDIGDVITLSEDNEVKIGKQHWNDNRINLDDEESEGEQKNCVETTNNDIHDQLQKNDQTDLLFNTKSEEKLNINIDKSVDVNKDEEVKKWLDDAGEDHVFNCEEPEEAKDTGNNKTVELDEEPLPIHLVQRAKIQSKVTDKLEKCEVDKSVDVTYLEEEVIPSGLQNNQDLTLVKSLSFPSGKARSKQCKPIGLSRKRKSLEHTVSDGKFKQITFEKFAFKRKSVC